LDEEHDLITIRTDAELQEAKASSQDQACLKIYLDDVGQKKASSEPEILTEESGIASVPEMEGDRFAETETVSTLLQAIQEAAPVVEAPPVEEKKQPKNAPVLPKPIKQAVKKAKKLFKGAKKFAR
jgi:hypothetical protein